MQLVAENEKTRVLIPMSFFGGDFEKFGSRESSLLADTGCLGESIKNENS